MADILDRFKEDTTETKAVDTSKKLRIGIIGTGWIAEAHIAAYKKYADAEIVAACDIIPGKAAAFCEKMGLEGVKCYDGGHKEMLDDADMKLDFVKNLQSQGKKVLVMGSSITDLLALTQADVSVVFADSSNVLLTITDLHLNMFDEGKLLKFITFAQTINRHLKRGKFISYLLPILSMISLSGLLYWFFQIILLGEIAVLFLVIGVILLIINIFSLSLKQ